MKIPRILFLLIFVLFGREICRSCNPEPGPQHLLDNSRPPPVVLPIGYFSVFNEKNGLPSNNIKCIHISRDKVLVGSDGGGLMIFDPGEKTWENYSTKSFPNFPSDTVLDIIAGKTDDTFFAATTAGLVKISGMGKGDIAFENLSTKATPSSNFLALFQKDSALFYGTDNQGGKLEGSSFSPFSVEEGRFPTGFCAIAEDSGNPIWGTSEGLYGLSGKTLSRINVDTNLGWVKTLKKMENSLIVGGSEGLFKVKEETGKPYLLGTWITGISYPSSYSEKTFDQILASKGGLTTERSVTAKIKQYQEESKTLQLEMFQFWNRYSTTGDKAAPNAEFIAEARKAAAVIQKKIDVLAKKMSAFAANSPLIKGIWIGTQDQGVIFKDAAGDTRTLTRENSKLPSNRITCLATADSGETWIGTFDGGLLRYSKSTFQPINKPEKIWSGEPITMKAIGDQLYVGEKENGLWIIQTKNVKDQSTLTDESLKGFHKNVFDVQLDPLGNLWTAGDKGVWMLGSARNLHFSEKDGLPDEKVRFIDIDPRGKVAVAGGKSALISGQVSLFNGSKFSCLHVDLLKKALIEALARGTEILDQFGMIDTFQGNFDIKNASQALAMYDDGRNSGQITALLLLPQYLLLGTESGQMYIYDGQGFKWLSSQGFKLSGKILDLFRWGEAGYMVLAKGQIQTFNGRDYQPIFPSPDFSTTEYTDFCLDDRNPHHIWVAFKSPGGGGVGFFDGMNWTQKEWKFPVTKVAVSDPYVFFATSEGIYRYFR